MKTSTKLIIAGTTIGVVVAGALIAKHFINVANEGIGAEQPAQLPDLDQVIFVYCRSGRRSKEASAKLAALGYTNIYEFGGILDWDGEIENTFETDRECSIRSYRVYGKTFLSRLYEDDTHDRYFHLYFNPSRQAAERERLETHLDKCKLHMDKHIGDQITLGKTYHHYFKLTYDKSGKLISYRGHDDVIQQELLTCGYFCIITSEEMTAAQALIHYKGRDISEKGILGGTAFEQKATHTEKTVCHFL